MFKHVYKTYNSKQKLTKPKLRYLSCDQYGYQNQQ